MTATFPGYTRLLRPTDLLAALDGKPIQTLADYGAWHAQRCALQGARAWHAGVLEAEVNHGRWIARCVCGGAALVHPEWPTAYCGGCGAICAPRVPSEWRAIEAVLCRRPNRSTQNWVGEPLSVLEDENRAHGLLEE